MLRFLRIRNLAVIEGVDVEFEPGFNVLTGETGAGKSIVVEAAGLLLGTRAAAELVRTGRVAWTRSSFAARSAARDAAGRSSTVRLRPPGRSATCLPALSNSTVSTNISRCSIR